VPPSMARTDAPTFHEVLSDWGVRSSEVIADDPPEEDVVSVYLEDNEEDLAVAIVFVNYRCLIRTCNGARLIDKHGTGLYGCEYAGPPAGPGTCTGLCYHCGGDFAIEACVKMKGYLCTIGGPGSYTADCGYTFTRPCVYTPTSPLATQLCDCNWNIAPTNTNKRCKFVTCTDF
jgi:hypothetical protein